MKATTKNGFYCYLRSMRDGVTVSMNRNNPSAYRESIILIFSAIFMASLMGQLTVSMFDQSVMAIIPGLSWLFYAAVLSLGMYLRNRPAEFNLLPISYKWRSLYFYLAMFVIVAVMMVVFLVAILVIMLFTFLMLAIISGGAIFKEISVEVEDGIGEIVPIGWQGQLFGVILILTVIGAASLIILIKSGKLRNVLCFVYPLVQHIVLVIMLNIANKYSVGSGFALSGNLFASFKYLPLSWLWLTIFGAAAIGLLTYSVIRIIRYHRPKDY